MKKPSIEEVKEYFKDAEIVECLSSKKKIDLKYMTEKEFHDWSTKWWIDYENHPNLEYRNNSCLLFSEDRGYAKILTYKTPQLKPISMRCTQEQFDAIKPNLEGLNLNEYCDSYFNNTMNCFLTNYYNRQIMISSTLSPTCYHETIVYETWNERIFLEACGIKIKETMKYEITKEQIKKINSNAENINATGIQSYLKEWFPEAFETVLITGKWYRHKKYDDVLILVCDTADNRIKCYGFQEGYFFDNRETPMYWGLANSRYWRKATESEVFEALKKEAVRRGFVEEVYFMPTNNEVDDPIRKSYKSVTFAYDKSDNKLIFCNRSIFQNGKWAEIIPTITKEEAEKLLNKKIV